MTLTPKRTTSVPGEPEGDTDVERRLQQEVVPVAAAMRIDPGRAIPTDQVFAEIRDLHARRQMRGSGGD